MTAELNYIVVAVVFITIISTGAFIRFWLKNSILKNKIELMEREREQLLESLRAAQMSPESAQIITQLSKHIEILERLLKQRDVRIKEQDRYIERLVAGWGRLHKTLRQKKFVIGLEIPPSTQRLLADLVQQMNTKLSLNEVETICFALEVDYENLNPGGKMAKIESLVQYLRQRGRLADLLQWLAKRRPDTNWIEL